MNDSPSPHSPESHEMADVEERENDMHEYIKCLPMDKIVKLRQYIRELKGESELLHATTSNLENVPNGDTSVKGAKRASTARVHTERRGEKTGKRKRKGHRLHRNS